MNTQLIFLAASHTDTNNSRLDKYLDGYATIQFTPRGGVEVGYDEEWFPLVGGPHFWPAHPGVRIRFRTAPGHEYWAHRHIGFRGPLIERWRAEGFWPEQPQAAPPSRSGEEWDEYFNELIALSRRTDGWGRRRAINRLEDLLLELADARTQTQLARAPVHEPWLGGVLDRLAARPDGDNPAVDYGVLAQELGMSVATLRRRFKRAMNTTLHSYLLRSRVDAARTLLAETDLPIKAVAQRLGYDNVYFFSRQFHQLAGVSPGVFRKSRMDKTLSN